MQKRIKDTIILLLSLIAIFQIYIYTMPPAFKSNDSPETITSAYMLGISHPPGYPLFTMAAKIFSWLPIGAPAFRINLFAVFLAMIVLFFSYFLLKQNTWLIFGYEDKIINFFSVFILAFSFIFWNQAIEAKGGIYILNLLFLAILMYLSIKLFRGLNIKYIYLMAFIYGLSLSNHWPSMIILLPVFGYLVFKYRQKIDQKNIITMVLLLFTGLSPYLYLPIRAGTDGIFVFMARTNTWENFWWTILRNAYTYLELPTINLYIDQIKGFIHLFLSNFSYIWLLIFFGAYILFKRSREILFFYLSGFLIVVFAVVLINRGEKIAFDLIYIFLMPSQYISYILIIFGAYYVMKILNLKRYKYSFMIIFTGIILNMGFQNYKINNNRYDYIAYDFGNNIIKTIKPGSFFIATADYYIMPLCYFQSVEHKINDIKYLNLFSLNYQWGIEDFIKKYGNIGLKKDYLTDNVINIINNFILKDNIYLSLYRNDLENNTNNYYQRADGIVNKMADKNEYISANIFKNYSYRGIYDIKTKIHFDKELISIYSWRMASQGSDFLNQKKYNDAIDIFKKALYMPVIKYEAHTYYALSMAYALVNDEDNQIKCLKEAANINASDVFYRPFEVLGMIYYNQKLGPEAKEMFENAIRYGSPNRQGLEQYISSINQSMGNIQ